MAVAVVRQKEQTTDEKEDDGAFSKDGEKGAMRRQQKEGGGDSEREYRNYQERALTHDNAVKERCRLGCSSNQKDSTLRFGFSEAPRVGFARQFLFFLCVCSAFDLLFKQACLFWTTAQMSIFFPGRIFIIVNVEDVYG